MKDGNYIMYQELDGNKKPLGRFTVQDDAISFPSEVDKLNISRLSEGPISPYTEKMLDRLMKGAYEGLRIEKASSESVKKFGENNSV